MKALLKLCVIEILKVEESLFQGKSIIEGYCSSVNPLILLAPIWNDISESNSGFDDWNELIARCPVLKCSTNSAPKPSEVIA